MSKKSSETQNSKKDRTNNDKGILLEQIVAMLHREKGVKVETNVYLTPRSGDETRKREVDVLLTRDVAGYPVRIAIQCKNYGKPITIGQLGEFKDLLEDVGIPHQHGIIVCINGYQKGAERRAKELGIKTFIFEGLNQSRLQIAIQETFQFFVHLLLVVEEINVQSAIPDSYYLYRFCDEDGNFCGFISDLIVSHWRNGKIPMKLGEYSINLNLPQGWYHIYDRKFISPISLAAKVRVVAYLAQMEGKLSEYKLKEAKSNKVEKFHLQADFDTLNNLIKSSKEEPIFTEEELTQLKGNPKASIEHRIRLPKIFWINHLEPVGKRAWNFIKNESLKFDPDEAEELPQLSFEEIEGDVFTAMSDKAAMGEPVIITKEDCVTIDIRLLASKEKFKEIIELLPQLNAYPREDFAGYLTDALLTEGDIFLRKSLEADSSVKSAIEIQSLNLLNKALEISPTIIDTYYDLGIIFRESKFYNKSIDCFNLVVSAQPKNAPARYGLAETLFKMGNSLDALKVLNTAIEEIQIVPMDLPLFRARILETLGKYKEATDDLIKVWHIDYRVIVRNRFWQKLVNDVYKNFNVLGLAVITADIYLFYALDSVNRDSFDESKRYLDTAVILLEDIFKIATEGIKDNFIDDSINPVLIRANNLLDEIEVNVSIKQWRERLAKINSSIKNY
jgi:tetratricopeptide (TPR) repeat protein